MKTGVEQETKGYTISSTVVHDAGAKGKGLEKIGLVAAVIIVLMTGVWVFFAGTI